MLDFMRKLRNELAGAATDKFLEALLAGMDVSFSLSPGYRKSIEGFTGSYVFETAEGLVAAACTFKDGEMEVHTQPVPEYNVRIVFKNPKALRDFLLSEDQEILSSVLRNEVEIEGNINYIYKFGFMAKDLKHRLHL